MSTLEERIREFMQATGWDVPKIASIAGVSQSAVWQWIGGGSKEIKTIGNLEAALMLERESGFSALWLAKGKGPKMARAVADTRLGHKAEVVTRVTTMPKPFNQALFDALPSQQQQDIAQIAAYAVEAFTRYNDPPLQGKATPWPKRQHEGDVTSKTLKGTHQPKKKGGSQ